MSWSPLSYTVEGLRDFLRGLDRRVTNLERGGRWNYDDEFAGGGEDVTILTGTSSITVAADTKIVAHSLGTTPRTVLVTPRTQADLWVSNRSATTFTVERSDTADTVNFDWLAAGVEASAPEYQIPETNLALWLKGSSLSLTDGALVDSWVDQSGAGRNAVQASEPARPTFKTNIVNGHPVVRFDGSSDGMGGTGWTFTDEMVFVVMNVRSAPGAGAGFFCRGAGGDDWNTRNGMALESAGGSEWRAVYGFQSFPDPGLAEIGRPSNGTWAVYEHTLNGSTQRVAYNRAAAANTDSFTTGTASPTGYVIGKRYSGGDYSPIDVAEVIAYSAYDAAIRTDVLNYLADKYGITLT